jgi:phage baseplate assembly protein W
MKGVGIYNVDSTTIKQDTELLEENVTRILLTVPGERVGNPLFGSKFKTFLFDLGTIMQEEILSDIYNSVSKWEPRIKINNIKLTPSDPNILSIKIDAVVKQTLEVFTFDKVIKY